MPIIAVADDELEEDEVTEWLANGNYEGPPPSLLFASTREVLLHSIRLQVSSGGELPKVIFLDLDLHGRQNGLQTLEDLKSDSRLMYIPIVMYSQSNDQQDLRDTLMRHANSYLEKGEGTTQGERFTQAVSYWLQHDSCSKACI